MAAKNAEPKKRITRDLTGKQKAALWVMAGGRCEYNGCNKRLDRNILTQHRVMLAEHAHIIGYKKGGPRGGCLSEQLAHDISNIMLVCAVCHKTIDDLDDDYSVETLREMKRKHEEFIDGLYDIQDFKKTLPVIITHPIKNHLPKFTDDDVNNAILSNSRYEFFPAPKKLTRTYEDKTHRDSNNYWESIIQNLSQAINIELAYFEKECGTAHVSVFAFGPMPFLMQLGVLLGNKKQTAIFQWDRINETWVCKKKRLADKQYFQFDSLIGAQIRDKEVSINISLSALIDDNKIRSVIPENQPIFKFFVDTPNVNLVEDMDDIRAFRVAISDFMTKLRNAGVRKINIFPAMPLSLAVEFGRQILPKADPQIMLWDYQDSEKFVPIFELQYS
jgi:hypothetical protein